MTVPQIVLNIYGGTVQDVFCTDSNAHVQIVHWDVQESDPDALGIVEVEVEQGRKRLAFVGGLLPNPMSDLVGTDVEKALSAAGVADVTA